MILPLPGETPREAVDWWNSRWSNDVHHCGVCFRTANEHPGPCDVGRELAEPGSREDRRHDHMLPLCCPGCLCASFEESHPGPWRGDQRW